VVPALEYEPTLYDKRRTLPHLSRVWRTLALRQILLDQASPYYFRSQLRLAQIVSAYVIERIGPGTSHYVP
jgi:hypothetical protein